MTTIDPTFTIEDEDTGVDPTTAQMRGVLVLKGATINFVIPNAEGIEGATWSIIGKSAHFTAPTITPGGTPTGITASCVVPNVDGIACGVLVRARAAGGVVRTYAGKFYTALAGGVDAEPFFEGEKNWGYKLNERLADLVANSGSPSDWTFTTGDFNLNLLEGEETEIAQINPANLSLDFGSGVSQQVLITDFGATGKRAVVEVELWITDPLHSGVSDDYYGPDYYGAAVEAGRCIVRQAFVRENNGWLLNTGEYDVETESDALDGLDILEFVDGEFKSIKVTADHDGIFTFRVRVRVRSEIVTGVTPQVDWITADSSSIYIGFSVPMDKTSLPDLAAFSLTGDANITAYPAVPWMDEFDGVLRLTIDGAPNYDVDELSYTPTGDPVLSVSGGTLEAFADFVVEED